MDPGFSCACLSADRSLTCTVVQSAAGKTLFTYLSKNPSTFLISEIRLLVKE